MSKKKLISFFILFVLLAGAMVVSAEKADETPTGLLNAIKKRNEELDKKSRELSLKEQRLRILEQELTDKLKKMTQLRDEAKQSADAEKALADKIAAQEKDLEATKKLAAGGKSSPSSSSDKAIKEAEDRASAAEAALAKLRKLGKGGDDSSAAALAKKGTQGSNELSQLAKSLEQEINDPDLLKKEADRKSLQDARFANLAKIYELMNPEEAALRIQNMKTAYALEILPRMKPKKSGRVMGFMDPVMAAKLSEKMGTP